MAYPCYYYAALRVVLVRLGDVGKYQTMIRDPPPEASYRSSQLVTTE